MAPYKLFDKIILHKYSDVFTTSDIQFGFKEHSSTTKCTFALTETVNYFRKNKSNVYVMLLDATKAFDKVNYVKLFYQLIDRGLNPFIIRCLLYMYSSTCHERTPSGPGKSVRTLQVAARHRDGWAGGGRQI